MHRFVAGSCRLELALKTVGPWMVRGQPRETADQQGQVLYPLMDRDSGPPVLPGSSLKGVLRSTAERILRTVEPAGRSPDLPPLADSPFVHSLEQLRTMTGQRAGRNDAKEWLYLLRLLPRREVADSELADWKDWVKLPPDLYAQLSAASQLFGCTLHAGLLTIEDAYAPDAVTQRRSHVAIDRFTGGAGRGLLFVEQLAPGEQLLTTTLTLTNFAFWQIALLGLTLREISAGYAGLGGGTRKGQGQMKIAVTAAEFRYAAPVYAAAAPAPDGLISAQAWLHAALAGQPWYSGEVPKPVREAETHAADGRALTLLPGLAPTASDDWRDDGTIRFLLDAEQMIELFRAAVAGPWAAWLEAIAAEKGVADAA